MNRGTIVRRWVAGIALLGAAAHAEEALLLHARGQVETSKWVAPEKVNTELDAPVSDYPFTYVHKTLQWEPAKTALVIVAGSNYRTTLQGTEQLDELAPHIDATAQAARARGMLVVHAFEGAVDYYQGTPQRARCQRAVMLAPAFQVPPVLPPVTPFDPAWRGPVSNVNLQTRQHPSIEIGGEDAIAQGAELITFIKQRHIAKVIVVLLNVNNGFEQTIGPMGLCTMRYPGLDVVVVRDLTIGSPGDSDRDRELAIEGVEQCGFLTIESTDLTGRAAFRPAADHRPHVAFIVSDDHYHADKTIPDFARYLRDREGMHVSVLHGEGGHSIPGTENLATADVVIVFVRRLGLPLEQLQRLRDFAASGKPVIGLRTASHAFKLKNAPDGSYPVPEGRGEWEGFDHDVLGGSYIGHGANELGADITVVNSGHPILRGVEPRRWHSEGSLYNTKPIADDATLLMEGSTSEGIEPVAWSREAGAGRGRVFYTSLGHPSDFQEPAFRVLLINAIRWSIGSL